ncbi:PREDICTED: laminin subunit alpha-1-like, partial [Rhagoletis zephyria]|uniref:laminin subunit alpha-1-like n=1 Tax=Rhagoletis zephyria TaxID=28612 RepID=UPI0008118E4E
MSNDFMAVEMKNRKIRFIWSTGKSERIIKHQLPIATNDAQLNKDSKWYKIEVKRFGSVANLTVQRVPDANTQDPFEVSESLQSSDESVAKRMDLDRNSYFYIGGLPPDLMQPSRLIQARSFAGCLYELHLDGKKVGLWNFTSNIGCDACKEGATEPIDPTMYNFNDEFGYGRTSQARGYSPSTYLVSFSFRSFDEDALLFFTANPLTRDYVAIYLKDGKVYYETHFGTGRSASSGSGSGTTLTVVSAEKVNTGGWVQLRAERELDYAVLDLGNGRITEKKLAGGNAAAAAANLDLSRAEVYFGGVTPNFSTAEYPGVVFSSFVGCMNSPQIGTTPINLQRIQSFGIEPGCLNRPIRVASFRGDGFLELDGRPLKEDKVEFSFTFKTTRKSGILLLSTFEGKSRAKEEHYYFFYISNGMLEVRLNGGGGSETFYHFEGVNVADGRYHTVTCIKDGRRFSIYMDDEFESPPQKLVKARGIDAPPTGGLFIGGTPYGFNSVNKGYATNFHGVIRDMVFDSKLLSFNKPVQFRGVGIGREGGSLDWGWGGTDVLAGTINRGHVKATSTSTSQHSNVSPKQPPPSSLLYDDLYDQMMSIPAEHYGHSSACASPHHAMLTTTAMDAMAFGDSRRSANSSYIQLPTEDNEFYADFSLSFAFRSFYPNGILFTLARGSHHNQQQQSSSRSTPGKPVFVVALVDGTVLLRMKMSDRHYVELHSSSTRKLNDGKWHHVLAGRKKLSLWMNVDLKDRVENSKPKRRLALKRGIQAFIGGLPEEFAIFGASNAGGQSSAENELQTATNNGAVSASATFLPTLEGFKGCVRKVLLNDRAIDFRSLPRLPDGVGTCFTEIEKGSYFPGVEGASFAVYDDAFNLGLKADISFDFRTTRQEGVLLALANGSALTGQTPSLAVELTTED